MERPQNEILSDIARAKDSVMVIESTITKLDTGADPSPQLYRDIDTNVVHLQLTVDEDDIANSGEDLSELYRGIEIGNDALAQYIWEEEEEYA